MNLVQKRLLGGVAMVALSAGTIAGCGGSGPVTITWWHITTGDPGKTIFQQAADAYHASHPNVTVKIEIYENEAFKTKLQTVMQSGNPPDIFQSWGGGGLAEQANNGMLKDITNDISSWKDELESGPLGLYAYKGKQYGVPWDIGMIGFFYNKDLFQQAGITSTPKTWTEFLADVDKLKAANIVPYALAGKDEWPGMHLWTYLVDRSSGSDALKQMIDSGNWNTDACKAGGAEAVKLVEKKPFQPDFLSAVYDKGEAAAMGNGQAAMELMGQWAPAVQNQNSTSGKGLGDKLGWFPFPTIDGGKGDPSDVVGGGNGFALGKNAPAEAVDFVHYLVSPEVARKVGGGPNLDGKDSFGIPVTKAAEDAIKDPILQEILKARGSAKYVQLYLDQLVSAALGKAINDATAGLYAGTKTPDQVCQAITDAAKS